MIMPAQNIRTSKNLGDLLPGLAEAPAIEVSGIASDSRQLGEDYLFLACAGERSHGVDYIDSALAAGVCAIAFDSDTASAPGSDIGVPMIAVPGLASLLGEIANRFYDSPSEGIEVVGVTGTNGKTTVAWFAAQCLNMLDKRCAYVGTLGAGFDELDTGEAMTTPGAVELHGRLDEFRNAGAKGERGLDGLDNQQTVKMSGQVAVRQLRDGLRRSKCHRTHWLRTVSMAFRSTR